MFFPILDGIAKALTDMEELCKISHWRKSYLESFEYFFGLGVAKNEKKETEVRKVKDKANLVSECCQTAPQPAAMTTPDLRKRQRE